MVRDEGRAADIETGVEVKPSGEFEAALRGIIGTDSAAWSSGRPAAGRRSAMDGDVDGRSSMRFNCRTPLR